MRIDLKEKESVLKCIKTGVIDKKPSKTIVLLAKYYYSNGMNKEQIVDEIDCFFKMNYKQYNSVLWNDLIESIVKQVIKDNKQLVHIDNIKITKSEIDFIKNIKGEKLQKLAFTYLVYAKIFNLINPDNNNWVNSMHRNEIFKDADITETGKNQLLTLKSMVDNNILKTAKNITNNSVNVENYINEEDESVLIIDDFRALGLQYLKFLGDNRIIKCEVCGKHIKAKSKKPPKYCNKCAKEIDKKKSLERWKNNKTSI